MIKEKCIYLGRIPDQKQMPDNYPIEKDWYPGPPKSAFKIISSGKIQNVSYGAIIKKFKPKKGKEYLVQFNSRGLLQKIFNL